MEKELKILEDAFKIYSSKGCVYFRDSKNNSYDLRNSLKMYRILEPYLTDIEKEDLSIAQSHAIIGEGRDEFDSVCYKIAKRLFKQV